MKLIIQIPAYNEEGQITDAWKSLPKTIPGVSEIRVLLVDDGSSDRTVDRARALGIDHLLCLTPHVGLAQAFNAGLKESLRLGADIIVNFDADNQYPARYLEALIRPLLVNEADIVIGARHFSSIPNLSFTKAVLHRFAVFGMSLLCRQIIRDPTSGLRAYNVCAASNLQVRSTYTYTLETLLHARFLKLRTAFIPIRTNAVERPSRLIKSTRDYIFQALKTVFSTIAFYLGQKRPEVSLGTGLRNCPR